MTTRKPNTKAHTMVRYGALDEKVSLGEKLPPREYLPVVTYPAKRYAESKREEDAKRSRVEAEAGEGGLSPSEATGPAGESRPTPPITADRATGVPAADGNGGVVVAARADEAKPWLLCELEKVKARMMVTQEVGRLEAGLKEAPEEEKPGEPSKERKESDPAKEDQTKPVNAGRQRRKAVLQEEESPPTPVETSSSSSPAADTNPLASWFQRVNDGGSSADVPSADIVDKAEVPSAQPVPMPADKRRPPKADSEEAKEPPVAKVQSTQAPSPVDFLSQWIQTLSTESAPKESKADDEPEPEAAPLTRAEKRRKAQAEKEAANAAKAAATADSEEAKETPVAKVESTQAPSPVDFLSQWIQTLSTESAPEESKADDEPKPEAAPPSREEKRRKAQAEKEAAKAAATADSEEAKEPPVAKVESTQAPSPVDFLSQWIQTLSTESPPEESKADDELEPEAAPPSREEKRRKAQAEKEAANAAQAAAKAEKEAAEAAAKAEREAAAAAAKAEKEAAEASAKAEKEAAAAAAKAEKEAAAAAAKAEKEAAEAAKAEKEALLKAEKEAAKAAREAAKAEKEGSRAGKEDGTPAAAEMAAPAPGWFAKLNGTAPIEKVDSEAAPTGLPAPGRTLHQKLSSAALGASKAILRRPNAWMLLPAACPLILAVALTHKRRSGRRGACPHPLDGTYFFMHATVVLAAP